jgi:hypothetical protein
MATNGRASRRDPVIAFPGPLVLLLALTAFLFWRFWPPVLGG